MTSSDRTAATLFRFDNTYARLPERFYARLPLAPVSAPRLISLNLPFARQLGLDPDALATPEGIATLAGNRLPAGAEPIAMAYAGHQFGNFVPQLGDGRAMMLGEIVDTAGKRRDIQLKGSGRTPFSRMGDGRAALGPVLREYVLSEAFAALRIATTRALAAVLTGDLVARETMLPGAVLTRVASSHIRVGTFQFFAVRGDIEGLRQLLDYVVRRHYPHLADAPNAARALLDEVIGAQARLVAKWMCVGFIHGVMNTDNTSLSGETIDYGPCAFMDAYHPDTVFSSIDVHGRYAFANQPRIAQWNLARLAETLLPLMSEDRDTAVGMAQEAIDAFPPLFAAAMTDGLRAKLGLATAHDADLALAEALLDRMARTEADFTNTFRALCDASSSPAADDNVRAQFSDPEAYDTWASLWRARLATEPAHAEARRDAMRRANPAFIPRNHRVEEVIRAAVDRDDFEPFHRLNAVLAKPFDDQPENMSYMIPPEPHEVVRQTFCGT